MMHDSELCSSYQDNIINKVEEPAANLEDVQKKFMNITDRAEKVNNGLKSLAQYLGYKHLISKSIAKYIKQKVKYICHGPTQAFTGRQNLCTYINIQKYIHTHIYIYIYIYVYIFIYIHIYIYNNNNNNNNIMIKTYMYGVYVYIIRVYMYICI